MQISKLFIIFFFLLSIITTGCASVPLLPNMQIRTASLSPDGKTIVFSAQSKSDSLLYKVNIDGTGLVALTTIPSNDCDPIISPDGTKITYVHNWSGQGNICTMKIDGSDVTCLTSGPGHDFTPVYAPNGDIIYFLHADVFTSYSPIARPAWHNYGIYSIKANGTDLRRLTHGREYGMGDLSISAKGDTFLVSGSGRDADNYRPILIIPISEPANKKVVQPNLEKYREKFLLIPLKVDYNKIRNPQLSPDGTHMIFTWPYFEAIYIMDLKTSLTKRLWEFDASGKCNQSSCHIDPIRPRFSPDGQKIIFSTTTKVAVNIWKHPEFFWQIFTQGVEAPKLHILSIDGIDLRSVDIK